MQFNLKKLFCRKEKKAVLIIVGLGNPGDKYENTYHNMGYKVVDVLAEKLNTKLKRAECSSLTATISRDGEKTVIAKPVTFMNLSGQAVKGLAKKHNASLEDIIVIYDDIDLDRFAIRSRKEGSAGTHNGMKNIVQLLDSNAIKRIRIGVGRGQGDLASYVLSNIKSEDEKTFSQCFEKVAEGIFQYIKHKDFEQLMRELNSKEKDEV